MNQNTEKQEQLEQALAFYDSLDPETRKQLIQIMREMKAQQDRQQAAQTA